jgi:NADH pyrophosphatase NudC (nudix superfamily)
MLGFHALARGSGEPCADGVELTDVRWFGREELLAAQEGRDGVLLPSSYSISRRLIDDWLRPSNRDGPDTPRRSL